MVIRKDGKSSTAPSTTKKSTSTKKVAKTTPVEKEPEENKIASSTVDNETVAVFKPIKKGSTSAPTKPESSKKEMYDVPANTQMVTLDKKGMTQLVNIITKKLEERFVTKSEVKQIVTKTLQEMAMENVPQKSSKKK